MGGDAPQSFKILLIASEILVPAIIFVGAYFILKPTFMKKDKPDDSEE
jgi:hypothetical protein